MTGSNASKQTKILTLKNINMKTTIETKTAGQIVINSQYKGDKLWNVGPGNRQQNYNNHLVTVKNGKKSFSFDFWGSIVSPEISNDQENVLALYCALSEAISAKESFEDFCAELGYDNDSRTAERVYKACEKTLSKVERVFDCDHHGLINEIQETYNY